MKKVYICAPFSWDVEQARRYTEYALRCGVAPVTPHFYALCLNESVPKDHKLGRAAGRSLLWLCDELWIFGDRVTDGMRAEIQFCKHLNIRIRTIHENQITKVLGGKSHE